MCIVRPINNTNFCQSVSYFRHYGDWQRVGQSGFDSRQGLSGPPRLLTNGQPVHKLKGHTHTHTHTHTAWWSHKALWKESGLKYVHTFLPIFSFLLSYFLLTFPLSFFLFFLHFKFSSFPTSIFSSSFIYQFLTSTPYSFFCSPTSFLLSLLSLIFYHFFQANSLIRNSVKQLRRATGTKYRETLSHMTQTSLK
jgi:hypothetical protein